MPQLYLSLESCELVLTLSLSSMIWLCHQHYPMHLQKCYTQGIQNC